MEKQKEKKTALSTKKIVKLVVGETPESTQEGIKTQMRAEVVFSLPDKLLT